MSAGAEEYHGFYIYSTLFTKHNGSTQTKYQKKHKQHGRIIAAQTRFYCTWLYILTQN